MSAIAVRELAEASRRAENPAMLAALPDLGIVALAEALGCAVVTADVRLAGAPGPRCAITTVR